MSQPSDYGGVSAGGRYPRKIKKGDSYSFRCRDCGKLRHCGRLEVFRASRPRCLGCGGTLVETEPSVKRRVARMDAVALEKGTSARELTREEKRALSAAAKAEVSCRCRGCDAGFVADKFLVLHLRLNRATCLMKYELSHPISRAVRARDQ